MIDKRNLVLTFCFRLHFRAPPLIILQNELILQKEVYKNKIRSKLNLICVVRRGRLDCFPFFPFEPIFFPVFVALRVGGLDSIVPNLKQISVFVYVVDTISNVIVQP